MDKYSNSNDEKRIKMVIYFDRLIDDIITLYAYVKKRIFREDGRIKHLRIYIIRRSFLFIQI